ncbi:type I DNA topoisomerase [Pseudomonas sp. HMWF032]|uniref:type I DNA topoisomerase n=1 Tax=Pseudomonas sp. HMWF032 TaxID=2056866 RepID=UPI000D39478E|nr:type I DNA topoisomerase [Pseudomonas sp. HMWF032]PTS83507.1 type I DNA topoisomerase [Pseudomonas sp. HMWF032]PTT83317.1 type I DNA topoisomerase [Pseudomonas sp. HMWF010]
MGKSLVIVESPAKAKTINKYLGNEYVVKSSIGHIRDLPTSGSASTAKEPVKRGKAAAGEVPALSPKEKAKRQLFARMGVDPEHGWKAKYEILPGKEKVVEELRRLAKDADTIYLATDLDREGEAIAWHLRESIGGDDSRYKRVVFNEITKKAIQEAFAKPGELDINRVNAQQARRFLDRVVGYMVSPLLWAKIARGLSAGRVQSVAVKLVVEREKEIRAFVPEEYWEVHADLGTAKGANVRFEVARENGNAFKPLNEAQAMAALATLKASSYSISKREDKPTSSKPSAPFITSTLQQAASNRLGFGVKKTMMMAQRLYEAGYITYMRTDSTNLSADAVSMVRGFIESEFGKTYLPASPIAYSSKDGAQEAHEAIRPSDVNLKPTQLSGMERDAERLYELIWRQFVACQMPPAEYLSTTVTVTAAQFELRAKGRILKFDGYTRVLPQLSKPGDDDVLPEMTQGEVLKLVKLDPSQHFTKPPARYSEASLVKEMEKRGIGRPSTYAAIIGTIQDRGYVALHNRRFYSEKMGDIVTERLAESFSNLMDYGFTAGMEEHLDDVAQGEREWKHVLDEFYGDFKKKLEAAESGEGGMRANQPTLTDIACRDCGRPMTIRTASTGVFLGCSGYALPPKERCKATVNLVPGDEIAADDEGESESRVLLGKHRCPICSTAMDAYLLDETRKLHICGNNPDCSGYEVEQGQYRIKGYEGPSLDCDKCGSQMQLKTGRFGKFFGCTNSECKNTRKLLKSGEAAPPKMDPVKMPELKCEKVNDTYILRDGASGLFLAASQFPKNRETRAPLVVELIPHRDEIDPKYHFLCDAPQKDPQGRAAVVRYSRKTKEQYVQTEVDGKPTGWRAFFDGGKWKVEDKS